MEPNKIITATQLDTYLRSYKIDTKLNIIHYKDSYELNNYIDTINTSIFYKAEDISQEDINFKSITTEQEKVLILEALNKLKQRVS